MAAGGARKVSLGVFYTTAALWLAQGVHWLSTTSLKGTWQIWRRRKNTGWGEKKLILSSHAPLGAKATSGILKDAWAWQDLTSRGREVTNSITDWGAVWRPGRANLFSGLAELLSYWTDPSLNTAIGSAGDSESKREVKKVVTEKRDGGTPSTGGEKKRKKWQNSGV